jgi:parvulin-like peptidyl-prolyl isomerase
LFHSKFGKRLPLVAGVIVCMLVTAGAALAKPIAVVNGVELAEADFSQVLRAEAGRMVLNNMIENQIVRDAFGKAGLEVTQKDMHDALVTRFGSIEGFQKAIGDAGVDQKTYFDQLLVPQIMLQKLATKDVKLDDASLQAYYQANQAQYGTPDTVSFRIIVVTAPEDAAKVMAALQAGQDFAEVAKQYSADPSAKETGGLAEDVEMSMMPPQLSEALVGLQVGQRTEMLTTPGAQFVMKLEKRTPGEAPPFAEIKEQLKQDLLASRTSQQALTALRQQLRETAKVTVLPADLASVGNEFWKPAAPPAGEGELPSMPTP